ncbi:Urb2/Npa2 family-domain-containing protein [Mycotypha africana]|uniref:Urb2/Npa2 family-domain-containing protein n=1 Tax=Mycotypha africana TaxID=64632 RepID=UPI002300F4A0|nr:Urb2/Npa2 family-domain-containing protein [Mycotypha africana]KAI8967507.1 Urb2/Npa2 family-domain-containing protein [Mycotypha africana]
MLQHSYQATLLESDAIEEYSPLVNAIVDFVNDKQAENWYLTTKWSGSLLQIENRNTLKLAIWKLITDEWFDVIVQVLDSERSLRFISVLLATATNDSIPHTSVTATTLSTVLLRSANFYEAECLKSCSMSVIIKRLIEQFRIIAGNKQQNDLSLMAAKMIANTDTNGAFSVERNDIAELTGVLETSSESMDLNITEAATSAIQRVTSLVKMLLIFPSEHYGKNERSRAIHLATLIDIWSVGCVDADPLARITLSIMCRTFQLRFINYFANNSIQGLEPKLINWLIHSNYSWPTDSVDQQLIASIKEISNNLDVQILRRVFPNATANEPDENSYRYLTDTLSQRITLQTGLAEASSVQSLINLLSAVNSTLKHRKPSDLSNIMFVTEIISKVSSFIIDSLQSSKATIELFLKQQKDDPTEILNNSQPISLLSNIDLILRLTCLLEEYTLIVGPSVDDILKANEIADVLTSLASPLLRYSQTMIKEIDGDSNKILSVLTEFIAAFCAILSRHQQVDMTKRVLATIWVVFTMVLETDDRQCLSTLLSAFASWVQNLSLEQYIIVINSFVEQAEDEANNAKLHKVEHNLTYLILLSSLLRNCVKGERVYLKKQLTKILSRISQIIHVTDSLDYIGQMLKLLDLITGEQTYHYNEYEVSIILMCLTQIFYPSVAEKWKSQMARAKAREIFNDICSILSNLISLHKEQLVYMLSPFIAIVQSLLHCFKTAHVSLVKTSTSSTKKRGRDEDEPKKIILNAGRGISLLQNFAPLDDNAAHRLARLLTTIPQKSVTSVQQQKSGTSAQSLQRMVARHTPSLLIEYFTMQSNPTMSVLNPSTRSILTNALYDILDLCGEADCNYILSQLDGSGKALFKSFYASWKDNHRYTGQ